MENHLQKAKAEWEKIYPEYDLDSAELLAIVAQVATIMLKIRSSFLKEMDLAPWSFDTLSLLRRLHGKPLTPSRFMEELGITSGTMTNRIDILEKQKLVTRKKNVNDGRSIEVELTDLGLELIEKALKKHISESDELLSCLSQEERWTVSEVMGKLLSQLQLNHKISK